MFGFLVVCGLCLLGYWVVSLCVWWIVFCCCFCLLLTKLRFFRMLCLLVGDCALRWCWRVGRWLVCLLIWLYHYLLFCWLWCLFVFQLAFAWLLFLVCCFSCCWLLRNFFVFSSLCYCFVGVYWCWCCLLVVDGVALLVDFTYCIWDFTCVTCVVLLGFAFV